MLKTLRSGKVGLVYALLSCFFIMGTSRPIIADEASERIGRELQVELNRLGSSGDPIEREALLRRIIEGCQGTEEADAACWALSDLYLDAFEEPKTAEARAALERLIKGGGPWALQAKCRLLALSEGQEAARLRKELAADGALPAMLRGALR